MPRRPYLANFTYASSSPNRLRCLAFLTAAWGAHGFRPTLLQLLLRRTGCSSRPEAAAVQISPICVPRVGCLRLHSLAALATIKSSSINSRSSSSSDSLSPAAIVEKKVVASCEGGVPDDVVDVAAVAETKPPRVWLGNGPDPMAESLVDLPSAAEMAAAGGIAASREGTQGESGPVEELWLNGPFKVPLPPQPVVRRSSLH